MSFPAVPTYKWPTPVLPAHMLPLLYIPCGALRECLHTCKKGWPQHPFELRWYMGYRYKVIWGLAGSSIKFDNWRVRYWFDCFDFNTSRAGQAGGASFKREKNYKPKKEFACSSLMPKPRFLCARPFRRSTWWWRFGGGWLRFWWRFPCWFFHALEMHFAWANTACRAPAIYPNLSNCCACHEKWHSNITKCCACQEKWHLNITRATGRTPTSPNTAPATKNVSYDWSSFAYATSLTMRGATGFTLQQHHQKLRLQEKHSRDGSSSHMKRHLQCADQQHSPSNVTKYCACHAKKWRSEIWRQSAENWWSVMCNGGRFENDLSMIRTWTRHFAPVCSPSLLFTLCRRILYGKMQHLRSGYLPELHQMLRLPRKVTLQHHQRLHLPRKVTLQHPQMLRQPWKVRPQRHQMSCCLAELLFDCIVWRKFRSLASDNMERWKAEIRRRVRRK